MPGFDQLIEHQARISQRSPTAAPYPVPVSEIQWRQENPVEEETPWWLLATEAGIQSVKQKSDAILNPFQQVLRSEAEREAFAIAEIRQGDWTGYEGW